MPTLGQRRDSGAYGFSDFSSPAKSGDNDEEEFGFPDSTAGSHGAAASPIKWETSQAPNGKTYWFNRATGESRWTAPPSSNTLSPPVPRMYYSYVTIFSRIYALLSPHVQLQWCGNSETLLHARPPAKDIYTPLTFGGC